VALRQRQDESIAGEGLQRGLPARARILAFGSCAAAPAATPQNDLKLNCRLTARKILNICFIGFFYNQFPK
jgi:hypothetical protein